MNVKLKSIVNWFEGFKIPLWVWLIEVFIFGGMRYVLEGNIYDYNYDIVILFHAIAYYLFIFSFGFMILKISTNEKIERISSAYSFFIPVILIPPLVDHYIFGRTTGYPYPTKSNWDIITISFFQRYTTVPSHGYQIEFGIYLLLLFIYIYSKLEKGGVIQKSTLSLSTVFTTYVVIMLLSTPELSPIFNLFYLPSSPSVCVKDFYYWILLFRYYVVSILFLLIASLIENHKKLYHILRDCSLLRTLHFALMYFLGFYIVQSTLEWGIIPGRMNIIVLMLGIISTVFGWFFVVGINNYYDREFDLLTNITRGLPSGHYSPNDLLLFSMVSVTLGIFILYPMIYNAIIFYILFLLLGFIYSYPPLYLKRYGVKTIFIGLGSSLIFATGYFSPEYSFNMGINMQFLEYFVIIFLIFSVGSMINDLKDYESDKLAGVRTIFTWFGRERGIKITSLLLLFAYILPSLICPQGFIFFSLIAVIASFLFWKERVFFVYITYFLEYIVLLIFL